MGIVAVNYAHMQLDIYLLFAVIYNRSDLFIGLASFQTLIAIYCILDIAIVPSAGKFWGMAYPIIASVPLTALVNVYAYFLNTGLVGEELYALRASTVASTVTSVLVIFAGTVFYVGKFPERYYSRVIYDYCGSHFWFHNLIVVAIMASFQTEPYIKILDIRRQLL
jgi:predicted membrane channel-forming protein YqfA (hemolysin III family)